MNRREFLGRTAAAAAVALVPVGASGAAAKPKRPNILFFLVDDMGWMDTSINGSKYYDTPNMERLAAESMRFTDAHSASPLCSPTRASIMTGKFPQRLRITTPACHLPELDHTPRVARSGPKWSRTVSVESRRKLPHAEFTIAEALKRAGYATSFFGKWHLGRDRKYWTGRHGFDVNVGGTGAPGPRSYFSPYRNPMIEDGPKGQYITDRLTTEAVKYLRKHKETAAGQPFFMCLWHFAVHAPFQAKTELIERFRKTTDPGGRQDSPTMAAMLKSMDESLGTVMDTLTKLGLADDTIVIFFSDNGGNMYNVVDGTTPTNNAPLRGGKGTVWEGGTRVPMMIKWPGKVKPRSVCNVAVSSEDFYPTTLTMAGGIKPRPNQVLDGVDLVPLITGRRKKLDRKALFCHFPHENRVRANHGAASTVRRGDWKLHRYYCRGKDFADTFELYDLKQDIGERNDLAARHPKIVAELNGLLDAHLKETASLIPVKNPNHDAKIKKQHLGLTPDRAGVKKLD